ncbi:hypothetical protein QTP88_016039 [Uroleucon formosanum]
MNKLNNDVFRSFLSKYCNKNIPCESTLRKGYFDKCYEEVLSKIHVGEHKIWVCIDETTDSGRRNVANIIVGILQPESSGNLYLLHTDYLDKVNSSTITQLFDKAMHILWPTNVKYDNILLFISDAALYMKKAGSSIQTLYPNIIHLTCLAHTCHNVCEEVRAYYKNVDQLISEMKKTFLKCTWINAVKYYCTNFNELKSIIEEFEEESESVRVAKRLFKMPSIQSNLVYIVSNFGFLPDTITKLETRRVLLSKSVDIVYNVQIKLEECNGEVAKLILDKFNKVISKNKGWENIKKINQVLIGETTNDDDLSSKLSAKTKDTKSYYIPKKYDDSYIKFGFIAIETNHETRPQCVICSTVLSNDALKPAKLERHLKTVHLKLSDRPLAFFMGKSENLKKMKLGTSGSRFELNEKVLSVSFKIARLIAKSKKPHTIGEKLLKPCLLNAVEEVLEEQLLVKIKNSPFYALQYDESTDVSQCCQLLVFVRFLDDDNTIKEELLLLQELGTTSKESDVIKINNEYFEKHDIMWEKLAGFCTDGAPAMLGSRSGLATLVKEKKLFSIDNALCNSSTSISFKNIT